MADGKYFSLTEDQEAAALLPISQQVSTETSVLVRMRPDSSDAATNDMAGTVRKLIRDPEPRPPIEALRAWNNQLGLTFFVAQVATIALSLFGAFAALDHRDLRPRLVYS